MSLDLNWSLSLLDLWVLDVWVYVVLHLEGKVFGHAVVELFVMTKNLLLLQFLGLLDRENELLERASAFAEVSQTPEDCSVDERQAWSAFHEQGLSYGSKQLRGLSLDILCSVRKLQGQALVEAQVENLSVEVVLFLEVSELQPKDLHEEVSSNQNWACLGSDESRQVVQTVLPYA